MRWKDCLQIVQVEGCKPVATLYERLRLAASTLVAKGRIESKIGSVRNWKSIVLSSAFIAGEERDSALADALDGTLEVGLLKKSEARLLVLR